MRSIVCATCVLALVMLGSSCETTQPLVLDQQTFQLTVRSVAGPVQIFNVYTGFEDNDGNGVADTDAHRVAGKHRAEQHGPAKIGGAQTGLREPGAGEVGF